MNMKNLKRMLCWILAVTMVLGLLPSTVLATGSNGFKDVKDGDWFKEAVEYVTAEGLMVGVGGNKFDPNGQTTRAMVVTVLHRMEGTPTASSAGFDDVAKNLWYTDAINWAQANGIVQGYGDGTFRPDVTMTREEMVAVFYRYSEHKGYDTTAANTLSAYSDHKTIQKYAVNAMDWAVSVGLITGFPDGTIRPQGESTRAQLATVLMRFAEIEVTPDDGKDEEDTEVSVDDKSLLSASTYEVLAESATDVVFYVNSTLTVPYFELFVDGETTGIYLYDDGAYADSGDDIPNDGCYTGTYTINLDVERDHVFAAYAFVGETIVSTNDISIFVYYELSDEQIELMDNIEKTVWEIINSIWSEEAGTEVETVLGIIRRDVEAFLQQYIDSGIISNLEYYEANYTYRWDYLQIGIDTMIQIYTPHQETDMKFELAVDNTSRTEYQHEANLRVLVPDANYSVGKVIILNCYDETHAWSQTYDTIGQKLSNAGFEVTYIYDFECSDFMQLQEYDSLILLNSHGNTHNGLQSGKPMICTEEKQTKEKNKQYSTDLKKDRIEKITLRGGEKVYWIAAKLFEDYYSDSKLASPIINLGCCRNYPDGQNLMVETLYKAGASAICGYSASVSVGYDNAMAKSLVDCLLKGESITQALSHAKTSHGLLDTVVDSDKHWNKRAELKLYGNDAAVLYHDLSNGKFDNSFNWIGNGIVGWRKYGDARSIYRLAGLTATSKPKMAIISSGFGSMNDETTSGIYQTFLVPGDANNIEFYYDVVSEEPMEYVGTEYDDIFQVDILNTAGEVLETLVYESVNTSQWYAIEGINFPEGDDTTYHTRWQKYSSNIIEKYRGQLIVLRFVVQDAGDAIYDTAALIDSVVVN